MKKIVLCSLIGLALGTSARAQDVLTRTIVVDTVELDSAIELSDLRLFSLVDVRPDQIVSITQDSLFRSGDKPLNCTIQYHKGSGLVAYLMLDDKGGQIRIENIESAPQILHIPKWHICKNRLIDGVMRNVSYYHHFNDSVEKKPFAEKSWQTPSFYRYQDTLKSTNVVVNDKEYHIPLSVGPSHSIVKVIDGYLSRMDEKKERKVNTTPNLPGRKKIKYNTYSTTVKTSFHSYTGILKL
jgi:hypothetical protein